MDRLALYLFLASLGSYVGFAVGLFLLAPGPM